MNSDSTLRKIVLHSEDFKDVPDGGGELIGYFKGNELRKIVQWIGLSHGNEITEFYFKDGKLIFVYEQFNSFLYDEKVDSVKLNSTEKSFEGRYWFYEGKMFDYITTGHNRFENDSVDPGLILPEEANELKIILDDKRRTLNRR